MVGLPASGLKLLSLATDQFGSRMVFPGRSQCVQESRAFETKDVVFLDVSESCKAFSKSGEVRRCRAKNGEDWPWLDEFEAWIGCWDGAMSMNWSKSTVDCCWIQAQSPKGQRHDATGVMDFMDSLWGSQEPRLLAEVILSKPW